MIKGVFLTMIDALHRCVESMEGHASPHDVEFLGREVLRLQGWLRETGRPERADVAEAPRRIQEYLSTWEPDRDCMGCQCKVEAEILLRHAVRWMAAEGCLGDLRGRRILREAKEAEERARLALAALTAAEAGASREFRVCQYGWFFVTSVGLDRLGLFVTDEEEDWELETVPLPMETVALFERGWRIYGCAALTDDGWLFEEVMRVEA